jgi:hypothetical protein
MDPQGIGHPLDVDRMGRFAEQPQHFVPLLTRRSVRRRIGVPAMNWHPLILSRARDDTHDSDCGKRTPVSPEGTPHPDDTPSGGAAPDEIAHDPQRTD